MYGFFFPWRLLVPLLSLTKTYEPHVSLSWFITPLAIECITVDGSKVQSYVLFDSLSQVIIKLGCSLDLKCRCLWVPIILLRIRYWSFFSGSLDLPPQSLDCQFGKSATSVLKVEASWVGKLRPFLVSMDLYALI